MEKRRIIISVASTDESECLEYHATFNLKEEPIAEVAKEFALIFLGFHPFVFASFPASTKHEDIEKRMETLWKKYKSKHGSN